MTARTRLAGHDVLLAKPATFMNLSGLAVAALLKELELGVEDLIVLYDELAFPLGTFKLAQRGSANGHNGVKSISASLGTEEWMRIRIGVGKPALADGREMRISLQLAQEELAQLLGASRQRVNQELKQMEREEVIRIEPGGLVVRNREGLMKIVEAVD